MSPILLKIVLMKFCLIWRFVLKSLNFDESEATCLKLSNKLPVEKNLFKAIKSKLISKIRLNFIIGQRTGIRRKLVNLINLIADLPT